MTAEQEGFSEQEVLLNAARDVRLHAYAPYSQFMVGAALLDAAGDVWLGANVENAAYPATICAERTAVTAAVVSGVRDFIAIAVVGNGTKPCTPCGLCRQVLYEFAPNILVISGGAEDGSEPIQESVLGRDLLPNGFGPTALRDS